MKRQPLLALFLYFSKYIWLALIPFFRLLISSDMDNKSYSDVLFLDAALFIIAVAFAFLKWFFTNFSLSENAINFSSGVLIKRKFSIRYSDISASYFTTNPLYKVFRLKSFSARTSRVNYIKNDHGRDICILLSEKDCSYICSKNEKSFEDVAAAYKENNFKLLMFSFLFSTLTSGAFYAVITFFQLRRMLGDETIVYIADSTKEIHEKLKLLAADVPPIVLFGVILIVGAFLFSFAVNFFRYVNFAVFSTGDKLIVESGFLTSRRFVLSKRHINFVYLRQSLVMRIFGVVSAGISVIGYSKPSKEMAVFLPIGSFKNVAKKASRLLSIYHFGATRSEISSRHIFRYVVIPSILAAAILLAEFLLMVFWIRFYELIFLIGTATLVADIYYLIVSTVAFLTSGASVSGGVISLKSYRHFRFYRIKIPVQKLVAYRLRQSLFQRMFSSCDIVFYPMNSSTKGFKLKAVSYNKAEEFLARIRKI